MGSRERQGQGAVWSWCAWKGNLLSARRSPGVDGRGASRLSSCSQHCCCSVTHSCPALYGPLEGSTPGFPVLRHLWELAQTHTHGVSDAIQPSHPLPASSPLAFNAANEEPFNDDEDTCSSVLSPPLPIRISTSITF